LSKLGLAAESTRSHKKALLPDFEMSGHTSK
jgi:hypothetical protein